MQSAVSSPGDCQVSSSGLLRFLEAADKVRNQVQFHSIIFLRHGKEVFRAEYTPYRASEPHTLYSLSKSFCSAAAGFAVSEKLLDWDTPVTYLSEDVPPGRDDLQTVTLESMLCMASGLDPASDSRPDAPGTTWARHVLSHRTVCPPMTHFHYNTLGTYLVSCMVQKATGQTIRDYLAPRLFEPLGIPLPEWDKSPEGICCGGYGLHLSCEDIAKFGQLLLQHGRWEGRQVLPEGWVERATRKHIAHDEVPTSPRMEWVQGYGYQFWRCLDGRYRGDGMYGQLCIVDEKRDAVLAVTAGAADMSVEMELIREHLFPSCDAASEDGADEALRRKLASLSYPLPSGDGTPGKIPEGTYVSKGPRHFEVTFSLLPSGKLRVACDFSPFGSCIWEAGKDSAIWHGDCLASYTYLRDGLFLSLRCPSDPLTWEGLFTWHDDTLVFDGYGIDMPHGHVEFVRKT